MEKDSRFCILLVCIRLANRNRFLSYLMNFVFFFFCLRLTDANLRNPSYSYGMRYYNSYKKQVNASQLVANDQMVMKFDFYSYERNVCAFMVAYEMRNSKTQSKIFANGAICLNYFFFLI